MRHFSIPVLMVLASVAAVSAQAVHFQVRRAEHFYDQKNWDRAGEAFQKAGGQPGVDFNLGNVAYRQKDLEAAAELFKKAAEKAGSPAEKADALYNLGNALLLNGQLRAAEKAFENSLRLAPNRPDAKKNLQMVKRKLNEKEPPPPPPPPKKPPPPPVPPKRRYLDRGQASSPEPTAGGLTPEQARLLLENVAVPDEQKNLRGNRGLAPVGSAEKGKKDW